MGVGGLGWWRNGLFRSIFGAFDSNLPALTVVLSKLTFSPVSIVLSLTALV